MRQTKIAHALAMSFQGIKQYIPTSFPLRNPSILHTLIPRAGGSPHLDCKSLFLKKETKTSQKCPMIPKLKENERNWLFHSFFRIKRKLAPKPGKLLFCPPLLCCVKTERQNIKTDYNGRRRKQQNK